MPDARVQAAIDNWGPRLIANGVDYNDFVRTTASISSWEEWLDAWTRTADVHVDLAERALAGGTSAQRRGGVPARRGRTIHFAKFVWVLDPARNRAATLSAARALYRAHALLDPTAERIEAPLGDVMVVGNLRLPRGVRPRAARDPDPRASTRRRRSSGCGSRCSSTAAWPRSRSTGPGRARPGLQTSIRPDYEVAVAAVLDALAGRPDLDLGRVAAAGVSLGGYYVARSAAFEPRLRAVAGVSGAYDMGGRVGRAARTDARGVRAPQRRRRRRGRAGGAPPS